MVLAFGMIKLSITFYCRRIFVICRGSLFDWITKAAIAIVLLWTIGCLFAFIFSCGTHIFANWGSSQDWVTYCGPSEDVNSAFVISDLITDVIVLCMPLPVVSTQRAWLSTGDAIAKLLDLEPTNEDRKKTGSYRYLRDWGRVSGYFERLQIDDID